MAFRFLISGFLLFINGFAYSQNLDSLKKVLVVEKHDTTRCKILNILIDSETDAATVHNYNQQLEIVCAKNLKDNSLSKNVKNVFLKYNAIVLNNYGIEKEDKGDVQEALKFYNQSLKIREELGDRLAMASSMNNIGLVYSNQGYEAKAINYYEKALKIQKELNDKESIATTLNNLGLAYYNLKDIPKVLEYYHESLKIREGINNKEGIAISLNNIAQVFSEQEDLAKALEYYERSLKISEETKNKKMLATTLNNIGYMYKSKSDYEKALQYYEKSLKIREQLNNPSMIATVLSNIGIVYKLQEKYDKALEYYLRGLKLGEEANDLDGMATALGNISSLYIKLEKYKEAQSYAERSLKIAQEIGYPYNIKSASVKLSKIYANTGNYKAAYEMQVLFKQMSDSINNETNRNATVKSQFKYEYDKKAATDSVKTAEEKKIVTLQLKQEKTQRFALYGGLLLVFIFAGFIFNRFKITQKQKNIIEVKELETQKQKNIIEEKQKEIVDSIMYAKRIQDAILPPDPYWQKHLSNSFVLYKPKDIVAGDFYWMEKLDHLLFFAAADCTGHGVPGALVSVVCSNALNRSLLEFKILDPGKLLDKTRELVIATFEKSDKEVKDGMDISLCCLNTLTNELSWAGANNPLWIIENVSGGYKLNQVKADKQPIGIYSNEQPFATHHLNLSKNSSIYIFTDGYPDQFGGPNGKKYKYKQLEEFLLSIAHEPMEIQKHKLENAFEAWKGNLEQVDDVCIIGVRI